MIRRDSHDTPPTPFKPETGVRPAFATAMEDRFHRCGRPADFYLHNRRETGIHNPFWIANFPIPCYTQKPASKTSFSSAGRTRFPSKLEGVKVCVSHRETKAHGRARQTPDVTPVRKMKIVTAYNQRLTDCFLLRQDAPSFWSPVVIFKRQNNQFKKEGYLLDRL